MPAGTTTRVPVASADALRQIRQARALITGILPTLQAVGVSLEGFLALAALASVSPAGLSMSDLARSTGATPPTLTRHIDVLATNSLVYREIDPADHRSILIYVSKLGLSRLADLERRLGEAL